MAKTYFPIVFCGTLAGFFLVSKLIFDNIFLTSKIVIDEEFHIPQGLAYCNFKFNTWNPKITTLPGLYLVSTLIVGPFNLCSIYWLRFVNLIASTFNLFLIYVCFGLFSKESSWKKLLSSINLSLLPPLYFFSHLYYTDILSVTFVLLLVIFHKKENHVLASFFGLISVIMRQTNIIWLIMGFGQYVLKEIAVHSSKHLKHYVELKDSITNIFKMVWNLKDGVILTKLPLNVWLNISTYSTVLLSFALFIVVNNGITVGDKTAHTATFHLPQIFYFSLFCSVFAWPYFAVNMKYFLILFFRPRSTIIVLLFCACIVYFNTLEHPYLLADNRHYTFYIWSRFYSKYFWFRYLMIPIYYFGSFCLLKKISTPSNGIFSLTYLICTTLVLVPQKMIEVRYFLIPYILLRLKFKNVQLWQLIVEFVFYCVLNVATFNIFFTKDIYWRDFDYVQKLIW